MRKGEYTMEKEIIDQECYDECMEKYDDEELCENECSHIIKII